MRLTDVSYAFPDLLLLILLVSVFGASVWMMTLAIAFVSWTTIARLVRGQVLSLREEQFVAAARALGASDVHIAYRHLLPNLAGPVIVAATFGVPQAIFAEAALSYIGLGQAPPNPSWGQLVVDAKAQFEIQPFLAFVSCSVIALTMLSFTLLGDGLRDALDPRGARRKRPTGEELEAMGNLESADALPKAA
jgi:oligopeptide transport system permease protein